MTRQAQLLAEGRSGRAPSPLTELPRLRSPAREGLALQTAEKPHAAYKPV